MPRLGFHFDSRFHSDPRIAVIEQAVQVITESGAYGWESFQVNVLASDKLLEITITLAE
jgi:hypothetical protein